MPLNLDWDEAACQDCGARAFEVIGPVPVGHHTEYTAEQARDFIARSRCLRCGGLPTVPLMRPAYDESAGEVMTSRTGRIAAKGGPTAGSESTQRPRQQHSSAPDAPDRGALDASASHGSGPA